MIQAVILAGGKGTRISPLFPDIPKTLVPVHGQPFLHWQLQWLRGQGFAAVHLALGYKAGSIREWLDASGPDDLAITDSEETEPLGTAGCIRFAEEHIKTDPVLVVNGDTLLPNLDVRGQLEAHRENGAEITLAVTEVDNAGRYGSLTLDEAGMVTAFVEKGNYGQGIINGGHYMISRSALATIPPGKKCSIEEDTLPMLAERRALRAFRAPPPNLDMGTPEGLEALDAYLGETSNSGKRV